MSSDLIRRFAGALERSKPYTCAPRMTETRVGCWEYRFAAVGSMGMEVGTQQGGESGYEGKRGVLLSVLPCCCVTPSTTTVFCDEGWTDVTSRELTPWSMAADNESAEVRYRGWKLYRISYSFRESRHTAMPQPRTTIPIPFLSYPSTTRHRVTTPDPRFLFVAHREIISSQWGIRRSDDKSLNYEYRLIHGYAFGDYDMDGPALLYGARGRAIPPRFVGERAKTRNYRGERYYSSIRSAITQLGVRYYAAPCIDVAEWTNDNTADINE